jgi:hypothetical protein
MGCPVHVDSGGHTDAMLMFGLHGPQELGRILFGCFDIHAAMALAAEQHQVADVFGKGFG